MLSILEVYKFKVYLREKEPKLESHQTDGCLQWYLGDMFFSMQYEG